MDYIAQHLSRMDEIIREMREMHESNLRLIEESREIIDAYNMDVELSRPEARVQKENETCDG